VQLGHKDNKAKANPKFDGKKTLQETFCKLGSFVGKLGIKTPPLINGREMVLNIVYFLDKLF